MKTYRSKRVSFVRLMGLPVLLLVLVLAACAPPAITQSAGTAAPVATAAATVGAAAMETVTAVAPTVASVATTVPTTAPAATMEPATAAPATVAPATVAPAATTAATMTVSSPATVMISANATLGEILTDDRGMTLYMFTKDTANTSNCYGQCATNWPPLLTQGAPRVGAGADDSKIGTTTRTDGSVQVTYNGWPVYYWINDKAPGDATGQNVGGVWFVLDRDGDPVGMPGGDDSSSSSSSGESESRTVKVSIKDFSFGEDLTIPVGTTVVWENEDEMPHTVTASNGAFDSGEFEKDGTFSYTFNKAGVFDYICALHPRMTGKVTVTG